MNWEHLKAFVWLRWRLKSNQRRRASVLNVIFEAFATFIAAVAGLLGFATGLFLGLLALRAAPSGVIMLVWDGAVVLFLLLWLAELMAELQRSEMLSMERFLHLPVSLASVFVLNYLGSMFSVGGIFFLPAMVGLTIGLVISKGPLLAFMFPLVATFALAVTALTYQFRGWLASMMTNQRRRRTIVAFVSLTFMLLVQLPNLWNISRTRSRTSPKTAVAGRSDRSLEDIQRIAKTANLFVPFGWVAYGAMSLIEGSIAPALLGSVGLALIGGVSLKRSYNTTLRIYTGDFTSRKPKESSHREADRTSPRDAAALLEKKLPGMSEHVSAIALAGFRSFTRAPEAKMMLLSPIIMVVLFGSVLLRSNASPPELLRPLFGTILVAMLSLAMMGFAGNQFGFDRNGFRTFVLASASRRDILLGKNLSLAPFVLGLALLVVIGLEVAFPMRVDHFAALLLQLAPMFMAFALLANMLSILAPMPIPQGSIRPAKPKGMSILIHIGFLLFPIVLSTTLVPLGIEFLLSRTHVYSWFPAYLVFSAVELAVASKVYPLLLRLQGDLLQSREQRILEIVTSKAE